MSYSPTTWETGDVITAEKLNNMEDGIAGAGGVLVMNVIAQSSTTSNLDKKCVEIKNAIAAGKTLLGRMSRTIGEVTTYMFLEVISCEFSANETNGGCDVTLYILDEQAHFVAPTDNDYPTHDSST